MSTMKITYINYQTIAGNVYVTPGATATVDTANGINLIQSGLAVAQGTAMPGLGSKLTQFANLAAFNILYNQGVLPDGLYQAGLLVVTKQGATVTASGAYPSIAALTADLPNLPSGGGVFRVGGRTWNYDGTVLTELTPIPNNTISALFANGEKGLWLDPTDANTIFQDIAGTIPAITVGQSVGYIADKTRNGNNFKATSGALPVIGNSNNGFNGIAFNGTSQYLASVNTVDMLPTASSGGALAVSQVTIMLVINQLSIGSVLDSILTHSSGNSVYTSGGFALFTNDGNIAGLYGAVAGNGSATNYQYTEATEVLPNNPKVLTVTINPAVSGVNMISIRLNGSPIAGVNQLSAGTVTTAAFVNAAMYLGAAITPSMFSNIDIAQLVIIGRALTVLELANAERQLCLSFGIPYENNNFLPLKFSNSATPTYGLTSPNNSALTYNYSSSYGRLIFETTAQNLDIDIFNTALANFPTLTEIGIRVNGSYYQALNPALNYTLNETLSVTLPSGNKTVEIISGGQSRPSSTSPWTPNLPVIGTWPVAIRADAPLMQINKPAKNLLLVYGDSIATGFVGNSGSTPPVTTAQTNCTQKAWPVALRNYWNGDVAVEAYGYRSLYADYYASSNLTALVTTFTNYNPAAIWLAIGINDYYVQTPGNGGAFATPSWALATFQAQYQAFLTALHTALPTTVIYCQTPINQAFESANSAGFTLPQLRTAIQSAITAAGISSTYVKLVDGTLILNTSQLIDGVHPSPAGEVAYLTSVRSTLGV